MYRTVALRISKTSMGDCKTMSADDKKLKVITQVLFSTHLNGLAVAQVRVFAPQAEGWEFESQPQQT